MDEDTTCDETRSKLRVSVQAAIYQNKSGALDLHVTVTEPRQEEITH